MTLLEALARFIEAQRECQGELSIEYGDLLDAYIAVSYTHLRAHET